MQGTTAPLLPEVDAAQEIADLKDKLANLQKAHDALIEERNAQERKLNAASNEIGELEAQVYELEIEVDNLKSSPMFEDEMREMARIRRMLKDGQRGAAIIDLDILLDRNYQGWRTFV